MIFVIRYNHTRIKIANNILQTFITQKNQSCWIMMFRLFTKYDVFKKIIELPTTRLSRMLSSDVFCKTSGDTLKASFNRFAIVFNTL